MPRMKVSLPGMFSNIRAELAKSGSAYADVNAFALVELEKHLREVVAGKATLQEFAEHYCLTGEK